MKQRYTQFTKTLSNDEQDTEKEKKTQNEYIETNKIDQHLNELVNEIKQ